jgi:hypothetical protein
MNNFEEITEKLRQIANDRHQASLRAIDEFEASLRAIDAIAASLGRLIPQAPIAPALSSNGSGPIQQTDSRSNVERVLATIGEGNCPKSVEEMSAETGLSEAQVRGVLYAKPVQPKITAQRIGKKMRYITNDGQRGLEEMKADDT